MSVLGWSALVLSLLIVFLLIKKLFWQCKLPSLHNRHVVVTGGSSGIGQSVAIKAAKLGAHVTIIARNVNKLEAAVEKIKTHKSSSAQIIKYISLDVSKNYEAIKEALEKCEQDVGPTYLLVNCAGMAVCGKIEDTPSENYRHMMDLNYFGTVYPTKAIVKGMKSRQEGYIVITGSQASLLGIFGMSAYCGSKFALRGFAESLYCELKPFNIGVTLSLPPDTDTPGFENEQKDKPIETKLICENAGLAQPDDVAEKLLADTFSRTFLSSTGLEGTILTTLCCGMGPLSSLSDTFLQIMLMGFLRLVSVGYILSFERIINKCQNKNKNFNKKSE